MDRPRREHALWGLVGALSFLVLAQGYRLLWGEGPALPVLLVIAAVVWAISTAGSVALQSWLARKRRV